MSSIRDVAKRARVSIATVSRTLNNPDTVEVKTADRVRQAVRELRYYPNTHARSLVMGKSRTLGLIVSDIVNPFFPELIHDFGEAATAEGFEIVFNSTGYDSSRMASSVRRMLEQKVEGLAVLTSEMDQHLVDELQLRCVPTVFLDVGPAREWISDIQVDYAVGISQAMEHLLALGHRSIGFVSGPQHLKSARSRMSAFVQGLLQAGIEGDSPQVACGGHTVAGGFAAMNELLNCPAPPTAILASNDLSAIGALRAARGHGFDVPGRISIVGFDDIQLAEYTDPPLTTIRLSRTDLAQCALDALLRQIRRGEGESHEGKEYVVTTQLVVRESTRAVDFRHEDSLSSNRLTAS